MKNKLDQLRDMTIVVADTGNIDDIRTHRPQDATTNPSLLLKAAALPQYLPHLTTAVRTAKENNATPAAQLSEASDRFAVLIGRDILNIIPGRISTEVDARLSFNTLATVERAQKIAALYREHNISTDRFLIKIAATWEGIQAARMLEKEGIQTNLTLLFSLPQAAAAADAGAFLISPFVGRILDWHVARSGKTPCTPADDPGVQSVTRIWQYYRQHDHHTVVMGASFRNTEEIEQLAGCDRLTISPPLLAKLAADSGALPRMLNATQTGEKIPRLPADENSFRWLMNEDAMASEKLAEGIRNFTADQLQLNELLQQA